MEALGRIIAVCIAATGIFLLAFFSRKTMLNRQKEITIRSIVRECEGRIRKERVISEEQKRDLAEQLNKLGNYETDISVMERVRFEIDGESKEFYRVWDGEHTRLSVGSMFRIMVSEKRSGMKLFWFGPGSLLVAGGRIS